MLINRKQVAELLNIKYSAIFHLDAIGSIRPVEITYSEKGTQVYWYEKADVLAYKNDRKQLLKRKSERKARNKNSRIGSLLSEDSSLDFMLASVFIRRPSAETKPQKG